MSHTIKVQSRLLNVPFMNAIRHSFVFFSSLLSNLHSSMFVDNYYWHCLVAIVRSSSPKMRTKIQSQSIIQEKKIARQSKKKHSQNIEMFAKSDRVICNHQKIV